MLHRINLVLATLCFTCALLQFGVGIADAQSTNYTCTQKKVPQCNGSCPSPGVCNPDKDTGKVCLCP